LVSIDKAVFTKVIKKSIKQHEKNEEHHEKKQKTDGWSLVGGHHILLALSPSLRELCLDKMMR